MKFLESIYSAWCRLLTCMSPRLNNQFISLVFNHRLLNLRHPKTFHEKLVWLKLNRYIHDPIVRQCSDKYAVRQYITDCGLDTLLVPLIACFDNVDDVQWEILPNQFALKLNYGSGYNIICQDKKSITWEETKIKLIAWSKEKQYLDKAELQYKNVPLKVIVEQYLKPVEGTLPADYKVYCFNGEPRVILYMCDRGKETKALFFDTAWNYISEPINRNYSHHTIFPDKPLRLQQMIEDSRILSKPFPFVRVDYYCLSDKLYFGEMTFTPAGGIFASECLVDGKSMGELLNLSILDGNYIKELSKI